MKPLKLAGDSSVAAPSGAGLSSSRREPDRIEAWLDTLTAVLRASEREKAEIRDELESHLRERMRDLTLEGVEEQQAALRAIDELGEIARLAERFRRARAPSHRRLGMNIAVLSMAGAAAVAGSVSLLSGHRSRSSDEAQAWVRRLEAEKARTTAVTDSLTDVLATSAAEAQPGGGGGSEVGSKQTARLRLHDHLASAHGGEQPRASEKPVAVDFNATPMTEALAQLEKAMGGPVFIHWKDLESQGITRETEVTLKTPPVRHEVIARLMNESLGLSGGRKVTVRVEADMVEIATQNHFDLADTTLDVFELDEVLGVGGNDARQELVQLVTNTVESDSWQENGGEIGSIHVVGTKVFVKTSRRIMPEVRWIMNQLTGNQAAPAPKPDAGPNGGG